MEEPFKTHNILVRGSEVEELEETLQALKVTYELVKRLRRYQATRYSIDGTSKNVRYVVEPVLEWEFRVAGSDLLGRMRMGRLVLKDKRD